MLLMRTENSTTTLENGDISLNKTKQTNEKIQKKPKQKPHLWVLIRKD